MSGSIRPNLGLTSGYAEREDGWASGMEANLRRLDTIVHCSVIDKDLTTPPATPSDGDTYIIPSGATGAWAGHTNEITIWFQSTDNAAWTFYVPKNGWKAYIEDEEDDYRYFASSTSWESTIIMDKRKAYSRVWAFETLPPLGVRSGGVTSTLFGGRMQADTGVGANRTFEIAESIDDDPLENSVLGEQWWGTNQTQERRIHVVKAIVRYTQSISPAGDAFLGIGMGSPGVTTPWTSGIKTAHIHCRYNYTLARWEVAIGDGDTVESVVACSVQPSFTFSPQARELTMVYRPTVIDEADGVTVLVNGEVKFYIDNSVVHTITGGKLNTINTICDKGGTWFITSGSSAAGRTAGEIAWNERYTIYTRPYTPGL